LNSLSKALTNNTYQTLTSFIKNEIVNSKKKIEHTKITAYWKIGQAISKHLLHHSDRAEYGEHLFERLAKDLEVGETTLHQAVRLHQTFPIPRAHEELGWNHYQALLTIKDDDKRNKWQQRCLKQNLSSRELKKQLALKFPKNPPLKNPTEIHKIIFKRGELNTYAVVEAQEIVPKKGKLFIDFGFNIIRELKSTQKLLSVISKAPQYTYKAYVERIIDGDTLWSKIDCGFETLTRQKLRLCGIDCPELNTQAGQKAKRFVEDTLKNCKFIIVQTHKSDKYDRYLANIFFLEGEDDENVVASKGIFLNQELLNNGLAQKYN